MKINIRKGDGSKMKTLKIIPTPSFIVPEGVYRAKVEAVRDSQEMSGGCIVNMIRLVFDIYDDTGKYVIYKAGKKYLADLTNASDFRKDLINWGILGDIDCGEFDPETLHGKEADIVMKQYWNPNYPQPYCAIAGIFPAGFMIKTVSPQMVA